MGKKYPQSAFTSLVVLNFVVGFSWIAYHNYQPKLLDAFELNTVGEFLFYAQWLILFAVPGLAGKLSDNMLRRRNKYLIIYVTGITVAAMTFMSVALGVGIINLLSLRPLVPFLVIVWLISMNMFVAPANALLKNIAEQDRLPKLMAILIIGTEGVYALEPVIIPLIEGMGAVLTFIAGGLLVTFAGIWFQRQLKKNPEIMSVDYEEKPDHKPLVFVAASIAFGSVFAFIIAVLPSLIGARLNVDGSTTVAAMLGFSTLIAWPVSQLSAKFSLQTLAGTGWVMGGVSVLALLIISNESIVYMALIILGLSCSVLSVTTFPLALKNIPARNLALGTGIFLGIAEGFEGFYQWLLQ
jgi:MFS family permease